MDLISQSTFLPISFLGQLPFLVLVTEIPFSQENIKVNASSRFTAFGPLLQCSAVGSTQHQTRDAKERKTSVHM